MRALVFSEAGGLRYVTDRPDPTPATGEALVRVLRAGICSTDLEIFKGYTPGFDGIPGHEFVGLVEQCDSAPHLVGKRVVGEINCGCSPGFSHADPIYARNHAPGRTVLGIIGRDGAMAERLAIPASNLHVVPDGISDQDACFVEPLAAACRIVEQKAVGPGDRVAVIGDGKLGLLVVQMLVLQGIKLLTHFGKHQSKLDLPSGDHDRVVVGPGTSKEFDQAFDVVIECSGSSQGITTATAISRPMATIVLKSTCSAVNDPDMPLWSSLANDIVVNEKVLRGSRCGPFPPALEALQDERMQRLLRAMLTQAFPLAEGLSAVEKARSKGTLKVELDMTAG